MASSPELPLVPNFNAIHFLRHNSIMLDLPVRSTATAIVYYHRFCAFMSTFKNQRHPRNGQWVDELLPLHTNEELLTLSCLFLACKATEVPRKVRDLVNVGYRYYYPDKEVLQTDEYYQQMRSSLVTSELLLVRALDYDLEVSLPFAFCLNTLRSMIPLEPSWQREEDEHHSKAMSRMDSRQRQNYHRHYWTQKIRWECMQRDMRPSWSHIARQAWLFVWDSLCSPRMALHHSSAALALGCLYFSIRANHATLPMTLHEWVDACGASSNLSVEDVQSVVTDLLAFYEETSKKPEIET